MIISVLCTDPAHPVNRSLQEWAEKIALGGDSISILRDRTELIGGDILFLVSCHQIIPKSVRDAYTATLVLHASDLPKGRGWSPYIWAILDGEREITVSLLEAADSVDSGAIWFKTTIFFEGHELLPEINQKLFEAEIALMNRAVKEFEAVVPLAQVGDPGHHLRKRSPEDSRLDVNKSIAEQFELLRVVDSQRYPAYFDYRGSRYKIKIEKYEDNAT